MTVKQLKSECREKGLRVSGTKNELLERLESPTSNDVVSKNNSVNVTVGLGWGDERSVVVGNLIQKGFATYRYYSCDVFYYEVNKEKWAEILKN